MRPSIYELLKLRPQHQQMLRSLVIDETQPGTILHDFEAMLGYIKTHGIALTNAEQPSVKSMTAINALLKHPLQGGLQRATQKSFPHIQGLYLLARASLLTQVTLSGKKAFLTVNEAAYEHWASLNPTERYGNLLESWLLRGHPEILGEDRLGFSWAGFNFDRIAHLYGKLLPDGMLIQTKEAEASLKYWPGLYQLALLELFGLFDVVRGPMMVGKSWNIERIRVTPAGEALMCLLYTQYFQHPNKVMELEFDDASDAPSHALRDILQPYWPSWKQGIMTTPWTSRQGVHTFKVSWEDVWRHVAIAGREPLDELAGIILTAFDFDNDHLYEFSYRGADGRRRTVHHPYTEDSPTTSRTKVGDVQLPVGQSMLFLFDFGDNWKFDVLLETVDETARLKDPQILATHGEAPEQYPNWDGDDEEGDDEEGDDEEEDV